MKFVRIEILFFIWIVPILFLVFLYGFRKRRRVLRRFASARGLQSIAPDRDVADQRRRWKALLVLFAVTLAILALSGPQYGYRWQEIEQKGVDLIVAIDCSRSMLARDISPTRLDRARREIYDLLGLLRGDRVGLVAFAGTAFLQCPLTLDYAAFHIFLDSLSPDFLPVGGTDISGAVLTALAGFEETADTEKAIILITDGENTGEARPVEAAEAAKEKGVKLFSIGVGSEEGVPVPDPEGGFRKDRSGNIIVSRLDEETLKQMALITGGAYVRSVAGDMDLDAIYSREIRGKMEQTTLAGGRRQVWEDRYQWVLFPAVLALLAELFLSTVHTVHKVRRGNTGLMLIAGIMVLALHAPPSWGADPMREGLSAYEAGAYEEALRSFVNAQIENPDNPRILYNIGNAYYRLENYEEAARNFKTVLDTEQPELKQKAWYNLGNAHFQRQDYDQAIQSYDEALKIDPGDQQAIENRALAQKMKEEMERRKQRQENQEQEQEQEKSEEPEEKEKSEQQEGNQQDQQEKTEEEQNSSPGDQQEQQKKEQQQTEDPQNREPGNPEEKANRPEFGDEMPDRHQQEQQKGNEEETPQPARGQQQQTAETQPESAGDQRPNPAEAILNRLKDQPGKAMIPMYQERQVEKDW